MTTYQVSVDIILKLLNDARVKSKIQSVTQTISKLTSAVTKLDAQMDKQNMGTNKLASSTEKLSIAEEKNLIKMKKLSVGTVKATNTTKKHSKEYQTQVQRLIKVEKELKEFMSLQSRGVTLTTRSEQRLKSLSRQYTELGGNMRKLKSQQQSLLSSFTKFRWMLVNIGMVIGAVVGAFMGFDKAHNFVYQLEFDLTRLSNIAGQSTRELKAMIDSTIKGFGVSREEGVKAYTELAKSGFSAIESQEILQSALGLSLIGFSDLESSSKAISQTIRQFNLDTKEAAAVASALAQAANLGRIDVENLGDAMKYAGGIAGQLGLSQTDLMLTISELSNLALEATTIGTGLRSMMNELIDPSQEAARVMHGFNLELKTSLVDEGYAGMVQEINDKIGYLSKETQTDILARIFQKRSLTIVLGLLDTVGTKLKQYDAILSLMEEPSTYEIEKVRLTGKIKYDELKQELQRTMQDITTSVFKEADEGVGVFIFKTIFPLDPHTEAQMLQDKIDAVWENVDKEKFLEAATFADWTPEKMEEEVRHVIKYPHQLENLNVWIEKTLKLQSLLDDSTDEVNEKYVNLSTTTERATFFQKIASSTIDAAKTKFTEFKEILKEVTSNLEDGTDVTIYSKQVTKDFLATITDSNVQEIVSSWILEYLKLKLSINDVSEAQKRAALAFSITNKRLTNEIKELKDEYKDLKDVRFTGEKEALDNIHAKELAIKKERLAQLKLKIAIEDTNDALTDNKDIYDAWVETVNQFITSAMESGNLLGKNVSSAVKKYQSLLLSTSKFTDEQDKEKTVLQGLEEERAKAQLEYEIGIGEQHYALKEYIDELERESNLVYDSADDVKSALKDKKDAIDDLVSHQEEITNEWENAQNAVKLFELELSESVDFMVDDIEKVISKTKELIQTYRDANIPTGNGGNSGGGGGSYISDSYVDESSQYDTAESWANDPDSSVYDFFHTTSSRQYPTVPSYTSFGQDLGVSRFADGGLITKPTMALMGEAGPEMVVPLTGPNAGAGMNQITIGEINISGASGDAEDFAYKFSEALRMELRTI